MDKLPNSSNLQGLENEKPISEGEPQDIINFNLVRRFSSSEYQSTGEIVKEKSDIDRLQDEDFRERVKHIELGQQYSTDDPSNSRHHQQQHQNSVSEYDPVVNRDTKLGRLNLSIRYDDERSKLIIQIIDGQGIIRPEQIHAPEMCLTFLLIDNNHIEYQSEKQERIIVDNAPIQWKEPVAFCITYKKVIQQNLYIIAANRTDPSAPRDREVFIPLDKLKPNAEQINEWFNLQFVQSTL